MAFRPSLSKWCLIENCERGANLGMNKKTKKGFKQWLGQENVAGYICSAPFIFGFLMFMIVPMGISLFYAFCDYDITNPPVFTGLKNLKTAFTGDDLFWKSLKVTCYYALVATPLKVIFALIVALILVRQTKVTGVYRAVYYMPSIIGGSVAVAVLWKRMFATDGAINKLFHLNLAWLGDTRSAIWVLIILTVWQFGSSMLIFLSALKQINRELYEAAEVDGANKWQQFWKITLPLLTPTVFFNLVQQTINSFLAFTQCYIITQGKPMNSTLFYTVHVYNNAFSYYKVGYASCLAWIMLIIISVATLILFKTKNKWVYEA